MRSMCRQGVGLALLAVAVGCTQPAGTGPRAGGPAATPAGKAREHTHGKGPHGGAVADFGGGKYHIEFTVSHPDKQARVYILGGDQKTAAPIKAKDGQLLLSIKGVQSKERFQVTLKAEQQRGDPEGTASCFAGTNDKLGVEQEFEGTVSGEVDGTPCSGDFKEEPEQPKK